MGTVSRGKVLGELWEVVNDRSWGALLAIISFWKVGDDN